MTRTATIGQAGSIHVPSIIRWGLIHPILPAAEEAPIVMAAGVPLNVYLLVYHAFSALDGKLLKRMAGTTGLEPAASAVTGQRSNQLNYVPTCFHAG